MLNSTLVLGYFKTVSCVDKVSLVGRTQFCYGTLPPFVLKKWGNEKKKGNMGYFKLVCIKFMKGQKDMFAFFKQTA